MQTPPLSPSPPPFFYFIRIITGQHLSGKFYYHQALIVSRVEPPTGPTSGGTAVAIHGRFEHLAEIRCRFGRGSTALSVARVVDGSRIECTSAPQAAMGYGAQVKNEEEPRARTFGEQQQRRRFFYFSAAAGSGGPSFLLHAFFACMHFCCMQPCCRRSLSLHPSPLPSPHPSPLPFPFPFHQTVQLTANGQQYSDSITSFYYHAPLGLTSILPTRIKSEGT